MNRVIKFRAWNGKEMVIPYCVREGKACIIIPSERRDLQDVITDYPLMQSTGFNDALRNELFEGDLVIDAVDRIWQVKYSERTASFMLFRARRSDQIPIDHFMSIALIGNIYQNPELLK